MFGWKRGSLTWTIVGNFTEKIKFVCWSAFPVVSVLYLLSFLIAPPFERYKIIQMRFTYVYITRLKHLHMIKQTYCHYITARGQIKMKPVTSVFCSELLCVPLLSPWVAKVWFTVIVAQDNSQLTSLISKCIMCMYHDWLLMKRLSHWRYSTKQQSVRVREWERKQTRSQWHWWATLINVAAESFACRGKGTGAHGGR